MGFRFAVPAKAPCCVTSPAIIIIRHWLWSDQWSCTLALHVATIHQAPIHWAECHFHRLFWKIAISRGITRCRVDVLKLNTPRHICGNSSPTPVGITIVLYSSFWKPAKFLLPADGIRRFCIWWSCTVIREPCSFWCLFWKLGTYASLFRL